MQQGPNNFLERTLLKAAIVDEEYQGTINNLDMQKPPLTPSECKAESRRRGAKVKKARGKQAARRVNHTSRWDNLEDYYDRSCGCGGGDKIRSLMRPSAS